MRQDANGVEIKRVGRGDESLFDHVADGLFDYEIDPMVLTAYLTEPNHHFIAAMYDGVMIGQCAAVVHRHPDQRAVELYIDEVAVAPEFQRSGIAQRMLDEAFALGKSLGCEEAWVGTEPNNLPARGLYASRRVLAENFVMYVFEL